MHIVVFCVIQERADKCHHFGGIHGFNVQGIVHIYQTNITHKLDHRYEQVPYCTIPIDA